MPRLVRLYITQSIIGFAIAAAFVGLLLFANVANLWHLVTHTQAGPLAVVLLWVFNGIVFSGVQFGIAVMRMDDTGAGGGGRRDRTAAPALRPQAVPIRIPADTPRG